MCVWQLCSSSRMYWGHIGKLVCILLTSSWPNTHYDNVSELWIEVCVEKSSTHSDDHVPCACFVVIQPRRSDLSSTVADQDPLLTIICTHNPVIFTHAQHMCLAIKCEEEPFVLHYVLPRLWLLSQGVRRQRRVPSTEIDAENGLLSVLFISLMFHPLLPPSYFLVTALIIPINLSLWKYIYATLT